VDKEVEHLLGKPETLSVNPGTTKNPKALLCSMIMKLSIWMVQD
jgi:hypothetical protein